MKKTLSKLLLISISTLIHGCSGMNYNKTVDHVDIPKFMGTWYVWSGRTTFFESGAFNAVEKYTWNEKENRIDVDFTCRKDGFDGKLKSLPQKAWIEDKKTNARWKVQPFWPLKFDYLVIALDPNYEWTAIGVPNGSYLWIMGRDPQVSDSRLTELIRQIEALGYPVKDVERVPQKWTN